MYEGKRVLAVVPARGGSRGVPLKNLQPLLGRPLIAYSGDVVRRLGYLDRAVVSTDHPRIAEAAAAAGLEAPFTRPESLSGDLVGDTEVLVHALTEMERREGTRFDVVVMLQPTCPMRRPEHVTGAVSMLLRGGWDAVWTISRTDLKFHPLKQFRLEADGKMDLVMPEGKRIVARQQLFPTYYRNGAAYALQRECLLEQGTTLGGRSAGYLVEDVLVNIDTVEDFALAERLLGHGGTPP